MVITFVAVIMEYILVLRERGLTNSSNFLGITCNDLSFDCVACLTVAARLPRGMDSTGSLHSSCDQLQLVLSSSRSSLKPYARLVDNDSCITAISSYTRCSSAAKARV